MCLSLKCTLLTSWETFCIVISNDAPNRKLVYNDICGAQLNEQIHWKSMTASHSGDAYNVYELGSSKNQQCGRRQTRNTSRKIEVEASLGRKT